MAYDNRESGGVAAAAVVLLVLILGIAVLVLGGLFLVSARKQAVRATVAEQRVRAVEEVELARERDQLVAEVNPASEAIITLDQDGNISVDGAPVDRRKGTAEKVSGKALTATVCPSTKPGNSDANPRTNQ